MHLSNIPRNMQARKTPSYKGGNVYRVPSGEDCASFQNQEIVTSDREDSTNKRNLVISARGSTTAGGVSEESEVVELQEVGSDVEGSHEFEWSDQSQYYY